MTTPDLARLIATTPAWITRALRGDPAARRIRGRLALVLTEEQATSLNLTHEYQIATYIKATRQNFEAIVAATQKRIVEIPTSFGIVRMIQNSILTPTA